MNTVLIVDDEPEQIRAPMKRQIQRAFRKKVDNLSVLEADNGQIGLEMVEEHRPEVIILDVMMPVMDGVTACRNIRANPAFSDLFVIMLTGRDGGMAEGLEVGADLYLRKPYDFEVLEVAVAKGLTRQSSDKPGAMDAQTGLFTRDFFINTILPKELNAAERYREACMHPVSLAMAKIRGPQGEMPNAETIRQITKGFHLRLSDRGAAISEGEIAILMPNTPAPSAAITGQRLRDEIAKHGLHSYIGITSYDHAEALLLPLAEDNCNQAQQIGPNTICLNDEALASFNPS
ncbi:response regulator [Magnetococcus sp. PR-3]|uniref:response regulator n=1 Tax=Magnetococcus sp. PR-3 TaxID=3120355 RepID=UPI002FCE1B45